MNLWKKGLAVVFISIAPALAQDMPDVEAAMAKHRPRMRGSTFGRSMRRWRGHRRT